MQVTEVSFMRRKNLGNYEHAESAATVSLLEGDCSDTAISMAQTTVSKALTGPVAASPVLKKTAPSAVVPTTKPEKVVETVAKEVKEKKAPVKKAAKVEVTSEQVIAALRAYAEKHDSKDMAVQVLHDVSGVKSFKEVDNKLYGKLLKALAV